MKITILSAVIILSACANQSPTPQYCDMQPRPIWDRERCDGRDAAQPTPRPEPTPEPEKHPVCDGGARDCRDGETPTGWE